MAYNWFLSELVFIIYSDATPAMQRFDKQLRLIEAVNERAAYIKLLQLSKAELERLNNPSLKQGLRWEFAGINMLHSIEVPEDGTELHYSIEQPADVDSYLESLRNRNAAIRSQLAITA